MVGHHTRRKTPDRCHCSRGYEKLTATLAWPIMLRLGLETNFYKIFILLWIKGDGVRI
jgi:hypothetical protein